MDHSASFCLPIGFKKNLTPLTVCASNVYVVLYDFSQNQWKTAPISCLKCSQLAKKSEFLLFRLLVFKHDISTYPCICDSYNTCKT
jgi:hypothetical protein